MTLLASFEAVRYRGIDGLSLPRLSHANLVTGVNGIGKTALLEAIWLFIGRYNPVLLWNANVQRSTNPVLDPVARLSSGTLELHGVENGTNHQLKCIFEKVADIAQPAMIGNALEQNLGQLPVAGRIDTYLDGELADGNIRGIQPTPWGMVMHQNPVSPVTRPNCVIEGTKFHLDTFGEYLQRYSDMVRENRKGELTNAINLILPRKMVRENRKRELTNAFNMSLPKIRGVEILTDKMGGSYLSAVTTDGVQLPFHDLGGGVVRLSRLLLSFFTSRDGILLTDEMENGIHHSVLREVWIFARRWMHEWNVQFVATTHSAECIEAAMTAFADAPEDLSIHKLFMNEETGKVEAATFTGETLEGARDLDLEIR